MREPLPHKVRCLDRVLCPTKEVNALGVAKCAREDFRERLFAATIAHARERVPGYRELWAGRDHEVKRLADISKLPVVRKERMMADPEIFRDSAIRTKIVQHTSGTTGKPLLIHRGSGELEFIQSFFRTLTSVQDGQEPPLRICVGENFHGTPIPVPYPGQVLSVDPRDPYWDHSIILSNPSATLESQSDHIIISGIESQIRILTCQLLESGFDFSTSRVAGIATTGEIVTRRMRSWYEAAWGVPLLDVYSMTELFGAAKSCALCGSRHFDPQIVCEVVDPFTEQPIRSGYGILVATCLAPFVQKQPFIRYWTGDLVYAVDGCPSGELGFDLKGRASVSVFLQSESGVVPLVCAAEIYDVLDDYPDIARAKMFVSTPGIADHSALGHLKFRIDTRENDGVLSIGLTFATNYIHYLYPERVSSLCSEVTSRLIELQPGLKERLDNGSVTLETKAISKERMRSFFPDWVE